MQRNHCLICNSTSVTYSIIYQSSWRSGITKQKTKVVFVLWHQDNRKDWSVHRLRLSLPTSYLMGPSAEIWTQSGPLWEHRLCHYPVPKKTTQWISWHAGKIGSFLTDFASISNQQSGKKFILIGSLLLTIHAAEKFEATVFFQYEEVSPILQVWYIYVGFGEILWLINKSWFFHGSARNIQNSKNRMFQPLRMVLITTRREKEVPPYDNLHSKLRRLDVFEFQ